MKYKILHLPTSTFLYAEDFHGTRSFTRDASIYTEYELSSEFTRKRNNGYIVCVFTCRDILDRVIEKLNSSDINYFTFNTENIISVIEEFQLVEVIDDEI